MSYYNDYGPHYSIKSIIGWAVGILGGVLLLLWVFVGWMGDAWHVMQRGLLNHVWYSWFFPGGSITHAAPLFWIVLAVVVIGVLWHFFDGVEWIAPVAVIVAIILVIVTGHYWFAWGDINARHYNDASVYLVEDIDGIPDTLTRVADSANAQVNIEEGAMPDSWTPRVASATGALYVMQKTGDANANTAIMPETITYIYGEGDSGSWTAIRNGKNRQPMFGVASWSGAGTSVKTCEFKGEWELNRAFSGTFGKSLNDEIASYDMDFLYDGDDVWGYCDGDKPIIVIPGYHTVAANNQTVLEPYGVLLVTGSVSGQPQFEFRENVKPGELPGPVYPVRLVSEQRDALGWSAGRIWFWQASVGFESSDTTSQTGNSTDFLLKSKVDGRLYWVTPMKPVSTDSQTLVAYSVTPADEYNAGELNMQKVYVLNADDPRVVNLNDLENAVTQAVAKIDPGFFTGGVDNVGEIVEFIPTSDSTWQVFAERGGRAVYRIDISGGSKMTTEVLQIDESGVVVPADSPADMGEDTPDDTSSLTGCDDPSSLSDSEIAVCLQRLADELATRQ